MTAAYTAAAASLPESFARPGSDFSRAPRWWGSRSARWSRGCWPASASRRLPGQRGHAAGARRHRASDDGRAGEGDDRAGGGRRVEIADQIADCRLQIEDYADFMIRITIDLARAIEPQLTVAVEAIGAGRSSRFRPTRCTAWPWIRDRTRRSSALFALKGRTADRTVALIAGSLQQAEAAGEIAGAARGWPSASGRGRSRWSCLRVTAWRVGAISEGLVGVRVPDHAVARALAVACGHALTATSANRHGPGGHARSRRSGGVAASCDGAARCRSSPGGLPSTIVHAATGELRLLREGALPWSHVLEFLTFPS